ncbi:MAG: DUF3568 family protein [Candidatus Brocadiia bacterium]
MTTRQRLILVLPFIGLMFLSGCLCVAAAAVGGVAYVKGAAIRTYSYPITDCRPAVAHTFGVLGLTIDTQEGDNLSYKFVGTTGSDGAIEVLLKAKNETTTEISVRFGVFGNKGKSTRFHEELMKELD